MDPVKAPPEAARPASTRPGGRGKPRIATAWLASGLYVAPMLAGRDPKFQRFGVNFLFISLLIIVVGSFAG